MISRGMLVTVLLVAVLGTIALAGRQEVSIRRGAWEFTEMTVERQLSPSNVQSLARLGDSGWELVAVTRHEEARGNLRQPVVTYYFKRPKAAE
jgi:hypothetical protein